MAESESAEERTMTESPTDLGGELLRLRDEYKALRRQRDEAAEEIIELLADRDALVRQRDELAEALRDCADMLEEKIRRRYEDKYGRTFEGYLGPRHSFEDEMQIVERARSLANTEEKHG